MELRELLAARRMIRSFDGTPVDEVVLDELCAQALWAPTAGNSAGVRVYTLGASSVVGYFQHATDELWRERSRRSDGLRRAGAVVLVTDRAQDYVARYGEDDKAKSGLSDRTAWPVPYWHTDAAMATMALLLLIEEHGWQATIWGNFRNDEAVLRWAGIVDEELFCSILIGHGDENNVASKSLERDVPTRRERVRRLNP
ncbi:MAG TPA: nitroreductase family protein [Acidimicrobiales bacterium]